jgi:hypothetical protein
MAEQGIIEPSTSPWCSPVVILRKKDSSIRFAIDFRLLNHYTVKDQLQPPVFLKEVPCEGAVSREGPDQYQ